MMQHNMSNYAGSSNITTELIQKYLDENKQLILAILDNQNLGKLNECAAYQAKLQQNLMYLAAIADAQPHVARAQSSQAAFLAPAPVATMPPPPPQYMQQQQQQQQQQHLVNMMNRRNAMIPSCLAQASQQAFYSQQNLLMMRQERGAGMHERMLMAAPGFTHDHGAKEANLTSMQEEIHNPGGNGTDLGIGPYGAEGPGGNGQGRNNDDSEASHLKGSDWSIGARGAL